MEKNCADMVDPFIGTEAVDLPQPEGIAATWFYIKAQIANTHPGATLPFSPVSACPYSGGYPSGYGRYDVNTHGSPPTMYADKRAFGVTHAHQSGTGYINYFYNHLLVVPYLGKPAVPEIDLLQSTPSRLIDESARPGYYAGRLADGGVAFELTVGHYAAAHRYRFPDTAEPRGLAVDIANSGLAPERPQERADSARADIIGRAEATGSFTVHDVTWYFAVVVPSSCENLALWRGTGSTVRVMESARSAEFSAQDCNAERVGVMMPAADGETTIDIFIGISLSSADSALSYARSAAGGGFDALKDRAERTWDDHLGRVRVEGGTDSQRRMFYTALYHSMQKPVRCEESNFVWRDGPPLYADFATMWDMYKTQIPLMYTLCPEHVAPIVRSFRSLYESIGTFPPGLVFARDFERFNNQSRTLPHVLIADAFDRIGPAGEAGAADAARAAGRAMNAKAADTVSTEEWRGLAAMLVDDLEHAVANVRPEHESNGYAHLLDISFSADCVDRVCRALELPELAARTDPHRSLWRNAFDPTTGLMKQGTYYEGDHVHYSWRPLHAIDDRITLAGGRERFVELLDRFFGYGAEPIEQLREPPWEEGHSAGMALGRFDGTNNEVMLETPFAYHFAGRPDRTAEVVDATMRYHYADSPGGIPGNDDSGALSAWYAWNAMGLFPLPGRDMIFCGSPVFDRVEIETGRRTLRIERADHENLGRGIYVRRILLDGRPIGRRFLRLHEVLAGGDLTVETTGTVPG